MEKVIIGCGTLAEQKAPAGGEFIKFETLFESHEFAIDCQFDLAIGIEDAIVSDYTGLHRLCERGECAFRVVCAYFAEYD